MLTKLILRVKRQFEYASKIADKLSALGLYADVDNSSETLNKKIRNGEIAQYNFVLGALSPPSVSSLACLLTLRVYIVVGQEELDSQSVNVRNRDDVGTKARSATIPVAEIVDKLVKLKESKSLKNQFIEA